MPFASAHESSAIANPLGTFIGIGFARGVLAGHSGI